MKFNSAVVTSDIPIQVLSVQISLYFRKGAFNDTVSVTEYRAG